MPDLEAHIILSMKAWDIPEKRWLWLDYLRWQ